MRPRKHVLIYAENEWVVGHLILPLTVRLLAVTAVFTEAEAGAALLRQQDIVILWHRWEKASRPVYDLAKKQSAPVLLVCESHSEVARDDWELYDRVIVRPTTGELVEIIKTMMARKRGPKRREPVFPEVSGAAALTCEGDSPTV